jgi:phage tail protein X
MGRYDLRKINLDSLNKRRFYNALLDVTIDKTIDDIYVITSFGERLDSLAWKYYSNVDYWWIIAAANPELRKDSLYLEPGTQVRIPGDYRSVLASYENFNQF